VESHAESAYSPNERFKIENGPAEVRGRVRVKLGRMDQRETLTRREPFADLKVGIPVPFS
jgi:hypothetical protein